MKIISTTIKGYCYGFAVYYNPDHNPIFAIQYCYGQLLLIIGSWQKLIPQEGKSHE